jgi:predicted O-methyltransferase YrrM
VLNSLDLELSDPKLQTVTIMDLFNDNSTDPIIRGGLHIRKSSNTRLLTELASLAHLMQVIKPTVVFEIGTFVGSTTRLFALNTLDNTKIYTLDLPDEQVSHTIGESYMNTSEAKKITQLKGDSRTFDFSKWYGQCDFVWVDACHDYPFVVSDTKEAFKLCKPGGWIGWHDYRQTAWWSGVTRCVRETKKQYKDLYYLKRTTIALLKK